MEWMYRNEKKIDIKNDKEEIKGEIVKDLIILINISCPEVDNNIHNEHYIDN